MNDGIIPDNVCDDTLENDDGDISDGFTYLFSSPSSFPAGQHTQGQRWVQLGSWLNIRIACKHHTQKSGRITFWTVSHTMPSFLYPVTSSLNLKIFCCPVYYKCNMMRI